MADHVLLGAMLVVTVVLAATGLRVLQKVSEEAADIAMMVKTILQLVSERKDGKS
ncbi:MAG: hypothetical protein HYZ50_12290 [Deltaproteobacteria bacterium]|nr:hypothetical protein [Deltaproteobacteria bacterium]